VLRNTLPYMPDRAVHLCVVDPGVGGPRRPVALLTKNDRLFVGPDNGLLTLAADSEGGIVEARLLTNEELWLTPLSATFHGRDIFAPVAARLAAGLKLEVAGVPVDPTSLIRLDVPAPRHITDGIAATAVLVDRFGNVALNLSAAELEAADLGDALEVECAGERYFTRVVRAFANVRRSDILVLIDSYGQVAVAVNQGSAREVLSLEPGDEVRLRKVRD
jgi:S-adenosyl-L-methionine hydrolase (adenosine-forming)